MKIQKTFQIISYLQYPLILVGFFFILKPYIYGFEFLKNNIETLWSSYNNALMFLGLGISIATLQDTSKTQSKWTKKIWENPKKGKRMINLLTITTLFTLCLGIFGYFFSKLEVLKDMSFGIIVLGIGLISFLKAGIEVFENHRSDKKTNANF